MIQRVQSLYIVSIVLCLTLGLIFHWSLFLWTDNLPSQLIGDCPVGETYEISLLSDIKLFISCLLTLLLSMFSLLSFKNLKRQLTLLKFNAGLILNNSFFIVLVGWSNAKQFQLPFNLMSTTVYFWVIMGLLFVNYLAIRGVRKDIHLLASADRLR